MTIIITIAPDQIPEIEEIPEELRVLVASPGGPLQKVAHSRLLSKLIATNLCKTTRAVLTADLVHDADSVALVFSDPAPLLNGWYRKTGASGAGAWVQFETLALATRAAMLDLLGLAIDATETAETAAGAAAATLATIVTLEAAQYRYETKAAATAALAGIPADAFVYVFVDETRNGRVTVYLKTGGVLLFANTLTAEPVQWHVDPLTGSDANPGSRAAPFETVMHAFSVATFGDTIWLQPNAVIKEDIEYDDVQGSVPDGVHLRVAGGGRATFLCYDLLAGAWTANGDSWTSAGVNHLFGGAGSKKGSNRIYPNILYRIDGEKEWRQVAVTYRNDHASDAAGIAWAQAAESRLYVQDSSGAGSSYTAGWQIGGPFVYHVRLFGGANPNDCRVLVKQREAPYFGRYHLLEGVDIVGGIGHQALYISSSFIRNVELAYPSHHGVIFPGCDSENLVVRDGSHSPGYCHHYFGLEPGWLLQTRSRHKDARIVNWGGPMFGCHGVGGVSPAPDPGGNVTGIAVYDDFYAENVDQFGGTTAQFAAGMIFNRPVVNRMRALGDFALDVEINEPRFTFDLFRASYRATTANPHGIEDAGSNFTTPRTGFTVSINGGQTASYLSQALLRPAAGLGTLDFHGHKLVAAVTAGIAADFYTAFGTVNIVDSSFQFSSGAGNLPALMLNGGAASINIVRSHIGGGWFALPGVIATVTLDEHSIMGGDAGLEVSHDHISPVRETPKGGSAGLGEKLIAAYGQPNDLAFRTTLLLTSGGLYNTANISVPVWTIPAGFVPRGLSGYASDDYVIMFGDDGKAYRNLPYLAPPALVATGVATDFTGALRNGGKVWLLGNDGEILEVVMATGVCTPRASPVTFRLLGGVALDANNMIAYGCDEDEAAGGVIYTTDGGVTWAENASVTSNNIRCGALVNGFLVVGGKGFSFSTPTFWTGATVDGAFTARTFSGQLSWMNFAADAPNKRLLFAARALAGVHLGGGVHDTGRYGRFNQVGYIDASAADPDDWTVRIMPRPLPDVAQVVFNQEFGYAQFFAPTRGYAQAAQSDALDFSFNLPVGAARHDAGSSDPQMALNALFA